MGGLIVVFIIVGVLAVLTLMLLVAGSVYQAVGLSNDARAYPPPGKLVDVGGYRLHLSGAGEGEPTVIMDSGLGHTSLVWSLVQSEVARFTRAYVYDRAGYAWSDPGPLPRTSQQIVRELHTLLTIAGIKGPYVLVGHSFGGLNMLLYASEYPEEVAGLVLVDALSRNIQTSTPGEFRAFIAWNRLKFRLLAMITHMGLFRLFLRLRGVDVAFDFVRKLPEELRPVLTAAVLRKTFQAAAAETTSLTESVAQAHTTIVPMHIPLVVLSHGIPDMFVGSMSSQEAQEAERIWQQMQSETASLSSQGTVIIVEKSGHKIHIDQPEEVIAAIRQIVEMTRHNTTHDSTQRQHIPPDMISQRTGNL